MIGGRSLHKAKSFIANTDSAALLVPTQIDRDGDLKQQFLDTAPDYVIDASGPWQDYGDNAYRVAEAAIAAGVHYLDLADSTEFVCGIDSLNDAAIERDVIVISGLSTCPALTAAVVRKLSSDFASIESISGGISPSPFAGMGSSVVKAIAAYAGNPVSVLQGGEETKLHAFVSTREHTIAPPGVAPLPPMVFSLIDLPDLQLLPKVAENPRNVWFGVATRPAVYHSLLRLLARGVKAGVFSSLKSLAGSMRFFANRLSWGEHRGGMMIEMCGRSATGVGMTKSWHLVADGDVGPNVPVLASAAIVRAHLDGRPPASGARSAERELALADFESMFAGLGIVTGMRTDPSPDAWPLFRKVLGNTWEDLPAEIRVLHGDRGNTSFAGTATVKRGTSVLSRMIGKLMDIPGAAESTPVSVTIEPAHGGEHWTRNFSGHGFTSQYTSGKGRFERLICERFGPVRIGMALTWNGAQLRFMPRRWSFFGIPMPGFLTPSGDIHESVVDGRFRFHVEIRLPIAGHIVTYDGWLETTN
jgi:hypothetical protein